MSRRKQEIEVFSVSSLNLMSKALGAVILLFIIVPKVTFNELQAIRNNPKIANVMKTKNDTIVSSGQYSQLQSDLDSTRRILEKRISDSQKLLDEVKNARNRVKYQKTETGTGNAVVAGTATPTPFGGTCVPVFTDCPSDIKRITKTDGEIISWSEPTATDNCNGSVTINADHQSGEKFSEGATTVHYTATNNKGNTNNCAFTITVTKENAPLANHPEPSKEGPSPFHDPLVISLGWLGDKDAAVHVKVKFGNETAGGSYDENSRSMKFLIRPSRNKQLAVLSEKQLQPGTYQVYAQLSRGTNVKVVNSFAQLCNEQNHNYISHVKFNDVTLVKGTEVAIGTFTVSANSISNQQK